MTSPSLIRVSSGGVVCLSDLGLIDERGTVYVLSLYGALQQVRAIWARLIGDLPVSLSREPDDGVSLVRPVSTALRFRGTPLGRGKYHGLLWVDTLGQEVLVWTQEAERLPMVQGALSRRRIPYDPQWLPWLETLLYERGYLLPLECWGDLHGYRCLWDDDAICDDLCHHLQVCR